MRFLYNYSTIGRIRPYPTKFSNIFETYKKALPKFIEKCLRKETLTQEESGILENLNIQIYSFEYKSLVTAFQNTYFSNSLFKKSQNQNQKNQAIFQELQKLESKRNSRLSLKRL